MPIFTPALPAPRLRWSPDGTSVSVSRLAAGSRPQVFVATADGGPSRALTSAPQGVVTYEWSPDGSGWPSSPVTRRRRSPVIRAGTPDPVDAAVGAVGGRRTAQVAHADGSVRRRPVVVARGQRHRVFGVVDHRVHWRRTTRASMPIDADGRRAAAARRPRRDEHVAAVLAGRHRRSRSSRPTTQGRMLAPRGLAVVGRERRRRRPIRSFRSAAPGLARCCGRATAHRSSC